MIYNSNLSINNILSALQNECGQQCDGTPRLSSERLHGPHRKGRPHQALPEEFKERFDVIETVERLYPEQLSFCSVHRHRLSSRRHEWICPKR